MVGYKVRIADGSEIGPMDLEAVRAWFSQGLIDRDSPVLKPGSTRWSRLSEVLGSQELGPHIRTLPRARRSTAPSLGLRLPPRASSFPQRGIFTPVAGVLFLLGAAVSGFFVFAPERWVASLESAPWREIALFQVIFGLCLIRGWELGRKLVRLSVFFVSLALFPLAGFVLAQGVRGRPLVVLLAAWIVASGFLALLSGPALSTLRAVLSLAAIVIGWGGILHFGWVSETPAQKRIREVSSTERFFADESMDVALQLPRNWQMLRKDQQVVKVPPEARVVFAQPRLSGFAFLIVDASPRDVFSLDDYTQSFLDRRRKSLPSSVEVGRSTPSVGRLPAREVVSSWESEGTRYQERTLTWRDGWVYFGLSAWAQDDGSKTGAKELDSLIEALSSNGTRETRLQQAVQAATLDVPFLSQQAAEMLMGRSAAEVLEPQEVFRRSYKWASSGLSSLRPAEGRELSELTNIVFASVPPKDRTRLGSYFERVKAGRPTASNEDREMSRIMKGAVLKLTSARLARLQALYEEAIRAAVRQG